MPEVTTWVGDVPTAVLISAGHGLAIEEGRFSEDDELVRRGYPSVVELGPEAEEAPDLSVDVQATALRNIERERMLRAVRELPALERLVFYLLCGIGCRHQSPLEIAALTGLSDLEVLRAGRRALATARSASALAAA